MTVTRTEYCKEIISHTFADGDVLECGVRADTLEGSMIYLALWNNDGILNPTSRLNYIYTDTESAIHDFHATLNYFNELCENLG